jgi:hypothetical protein
MTVLHESDAPTGTRDFSPMRTIIRVYFWGESLQQEKIGAVNSRHDVLRQFILLPKLESDWDEG